MEFSKFSMDSTAHFYCKLITKQGGRDPERGRAEVSIPAGPQRLAAERAQAS